MQSYDGYFAQKSPELSKIVANSSNGDRINPIYSEVPLYFAYGSNINLNQMAVRCPDAKVVEPAVLENYELLFRGNGSSFGVATIAPKEGSQVQGLLWKITPYCEMSLDIYEGYPRLYEKQAITLCTKSGKQVQAMVYVMTHEKERLPTMPTRSYYTGIQEGFRQNGLPEQALKDALSNLIHETRTMERRNFKHKGKENNRHER